MAGEALTAAAVGYAKVSQAVWAPARGLGITDYVGFESFLQRNDAIVDGYMDRIYAKDSGERFVVETAAKTAGKALLLANVAVGANAAFSPFANTGVGTTITTTLNSPFISVPTAVGMGYTGYEYTRASYYAWQVGNYDAANAYASDAAVSTLIAAQQATAAAKQIQTIVNRYTASPATHYVTVDQYAGQRAAWENSWEIGKSNWPGSTPNAAIVNDANVIVRGPVDWSIVKTSTGETRWQHIQLHGVNNTTKPLHGVFDNDPVISTFQAWQKGQLQGIQPVLENGVDVYNIPMGGRVGWQGGYDGTGAPLSNVKIITQPGTTKIITAHPN